MYSEYSEKSRKNDLFRIIRACEDRIKRKQNKFVFREKHYFTNKYFLKLL